MIQKPRPGTDRSREGTTFVAQRQVHQEDGRRGEMRRIWRLLQPPLEELDRVVRNSILWPPGAEASQSLEDPPPWRKPSRRRLSWPIALPERQELPERLHVRHRDVEATAYQLVRTNLPIQALPRVDNSEVLVCGRLLVFIDQELQTVNLGDGLAKPVTDPAISNTSARSGAMPPGSSSSFSGSAGSSARRRRSKTGPNRSVCRSRSGKRICSPLHPLPLTFRRTGAGSGSSGYSATPEPSRAYALARLRQAVSRSATISRTETSPMASTWRRRTSRQNSSTSAKLIAPRS